MHYFLLNILIVFFSFQYENTIVNSNARFIANYLLKAKCHTCIAALSKCCHRCWKSAKRYKKAKKKNKHQ